MCEVFDIHILRIDTRVTNPYCKGVATLLQRAAGVSLDRPERRSPHFSVSDSDRVRSHLCLCERDPVVVICFWHVDFAGMALSAPCCRLSSACGRASTWKCWCAWASSGITWAAALSDHVDSSLQWAAELLPSLPDCAVCGASQGNLPVHSLGKGVFERVFAVSELHFLLFCNEVFLLWGVGDVFVLLAVLFDRQYV